MYQQFPSPLFSIHPVLIYFQKYNLVGDVWCITNTLCLVSGVNSSEVWYPCIFIELDFGIIFLTEDLSEADVLVSPAQQLLRTVPRKITVNLPQYFHGDVLLTFVVFLTLLRCFYTFLQRKKWISRYLALHAERLHSGVLDKVARFCIINFLDKMCVYFIFLDSPKTWGKINFIFFTIPEQKKK